jgi:hypothetical protein
VIIRLTIAVAMVLAVLVGPASATTSTGLRGLVTKGPITPVCVAGDACTAPAKGVTMTFTRRGVAHTVRTGTDGRYRIQLAAGSYAVRIASARFGFAPRVATVEAGRMSVRNFSIDTGIR